MLTGLALLQLNQITSIKCVWWYCNIFFSTWLWLLVFFLAQFWIQHNWMDQTSTSSYAMFQIWTSSSFPTWVLPLCIKILYSPDQIHENNSYGLTTPSSTQTKTRRSGEDIPSPAAYLVIWMPTIWFHIFRKCNTVSDFGSIQTNWLQILGVVTCTSLKYRDTEISGVLHRHDFYENMLVQGEDINTSFLAALKDSICDMLDTLYLVWLVDFSFTN